MEYENGFFRFLKRIGLNQEIQTGDAPFDDLFYIASDHRALLKELKESAALRDLLRDLYWRGFTEIRSDANGEILLFNRVLKNYPEEATQAKLKQLKEHMDGISLSKAERDPFFWRMVAMEAILFGVLGHCIGALVDFWLNIEGRQLDLWRLFWPGVAGAVLLCVIWALASAFWLRRSARAPLILSDIVMFGSLIVFAGGPRLMADLNRALDKNPPDIVRGTVVKKKPYPRSYPTARRLLIFWWKHLYFVVRYEQNRLKLPHEIRVSPWTYLRAIEGQSVELEVIQGYFGAPYLNEIRLLPLMSVKSESASRNQEPSLSEMEMIALATWRPEVGDNGDLSGQIHWREEHYPDGRLRQREPFVDGVKHGAGEYWHDNGAVFAKIPWVRGEMHGRVKFFRPDGVLEQWSSYRNGRLHGLHRWYDPAGNLAAAELYREGERLSVSEEDLQQLSRLEAAND